MKDKDYIDIDVITFEQAKILKEKGYPQETWPHVYFPNGDYEVLCCNPRLLKGEEWYCGGSLSLVQKWLRSKKGIIVEASLYSSFGPSCYDSNIYVNNNNLSFGRVSCGLYLDYEDALLAAIDKALKLL